MVERNRAAGEWIYFEGESARVVWFLRRGTIVLRRGARGGLSEAARAIRREGAFLGLEALVRETYLDGARALTDVRVCGATRESFDAWLGERGTPARTALEQTLLSQCDDVPRGAGADGIALQRVARWLLDQPMGRVPPVPRRIIADFLGMVPETLSRSLSRLASIGVVEVTRRTLRVLDRPALVAIASPEGDRADGISESD